MAFLFCKMSAKLVKNAGYFSRFQTKFRRRREAKTDYVQRTQLIQQDKTKYGAAKYRLVARITNTKVIAQIVVAELTGDKTVCQALSTELPKYGIKLGLSNYPAAYATGLLVARRFLTQMKLADVFKTEITEEYLNDEENRRPFKVILDVGLARTTTGAKVFAVMKGAVDGGLFIPHNVCRLACKFDKKDKDAGKDRKDVPAEKIVKGNQYYILGGAVADYMRKLKKESEEKYNKQFSRYVKAGITADNLEKIYKDAHAAIRKNPAATVIADKKKHAEEMKQKHAPKKPQTKKLSFEEKRKILNEHLAAAGLPPRK